MKQFMLILTTLIISAQPLYAAPPLSLDEALSMAMNTHPQIIEATENFRGAEARSGQVRATYYPQISFAAEWSRGHNYIAAQESIKVLESNTAGVYLKQTIYDFGRTSGASDVARGNRDVAHTALVVTRQDLIVRVKNAFYLLLATEKQVVAVRETVTAREAVFQQAQEYFTHGIRSKVDVARAEATLAAAGTTLIRAANNLAIARMELANAMGMASLGDHTLVEPPQTLMSMPERNASHREAVDNRAELQQLAAMKSAASGSLKAAKSSFLPLFTGVASAGYADRDFPPTGTVWGVGLNLTVPLFSGFSSVEQVREATAVINSIEARQNNLRLQISKEVESAWLSGAEAAARITSTGKEVVAATESRLLAEGRYQEGVGSIIEVTDAQSQALDAQTANIQARYDYYTAVARLDRAVGKQ
jgi:outer membrane protein TolC